MNNEIKRGQHDWPTPWDVKYEIGCGLWFAGGLVLGMLSMWLIGVNA